MSTDRFERRLPEVLTELALPRVPDYVDDLLDRTARTPQRPGWSFLERWFPVSTLTASIPLPRPSLRPLIVLALLAALVVASLAWYAGSTRRVPPPFGLARNGAIVTATASGEIRSVDPVSGSIRTLVSGKLLCCTTVAPDGEHFTFLHSAVEGDPTASVSVANIDGSGVRQLVGAVQGGIDWVEWSPTSDRLLVTPSSGGHPLMVDTTTGKTTELNVPFSVARASWLATTGDVVLTSRQTDTELEVYATSGGATTPPRLVAKLHDSPGLPLVSPDGSRLLYFIWGADGRTHGRVHIVDVATGADRALTQEQVDDGFEYEGAAWSPDGSFVASERYAPDGLFQIAVMAVSGGDPVLLGPKTPEGTDGALTQFSPDGKSLLVTYRWKDATWLLPVSGAPGQKVSWADTEHLSWQRLAP
jgi:dipeptidyl aminopeptidase/acylaminoacyl peptidase